MLSLGFIYLSLLISDPPVELLALEAEEVLSGVDDATLDGDGARGVDVVAGDHAHGDPGPLAFPDGFWHLQHQTEPLAQGKTQHTPSHPD